jgi:hypothetical protein
MYQIRLFAIRHSRQFEWIYKRFESVMVALDPMFRKIGYDRVERPIALVERLSKGLLFDCKMCGQCALSSTGMSCPMNCPKQLRNGPCGGVRPGGYCEVKPDMRCVWVLAWEGASRMKEGQQIQAVMPPVDRSLEGTSSWLRVSREKADQRRKAFEFAQDDDTDHSPGKPRSTLAKAFSKARDLEPATAPLAKEPSKNPSQKSSERTGQ